MPLVPAGWPTSFGGGDSTIIANSVTVLVGTVLLGIDSGAFWSQISSRVDLYPDVAGGFLKSVIFGVSASLMAVFEGYHAQPNPAGISRAATRTVVITSVWILLLDFILTVLMLPEV